MSSRPEPDRARLRSALQAIVAAWVTERNAAQTGVRWQYTTADARTNLARLYPIPVYDK